MASNGTEIEQLLLEALNSLIEILRNNTSLAASSSDDDDNENSLTTTANRLALSATIISIAAFVIALLQAVLQYAGANESVRQKCNSTAIGQVVGELSIPRMMDFKDTPIDFRIQMTGYLYRPIEEALLANAHDLATQSEENKIHEDSDFWPQRLPWQIEMCNSQIVWPSLLLAATVAEIPVVVTAFPSDALLRPFTQVFARVATQAKQREGETYDLLTEFEIESLIFEQRFLEVLTNGVFHVTRTAPPGTYRGLSGWAFRANRNTTKKPVILPVTNELLKDFDVMRWQQSLDDIRRIHYPQVADRLGRMTRRHHPRAEQLLWLQVYLLDREIQQVMKYLGSDLQSKGVLLPEEILFPPNKLGNLTSKIINAIRSAWSDTQEDSKQEPLVALERMVALELGVSLSEGDVSFYVRQLTDLLKLRCVFFAAYMMVIPDSSDFMRYYHSGLDIRLPMI
ncbi:hypothetical protein E8E14_014887 [Neopestalotiopsis sp. 37M]|nr:hypothetical protein E8E14_014887 [Neopestalotiopsis sp. 37M]